VPDDAEAIGFDVSHYQPKVDWAAARAAGRSFVFIKATESAATVDPRFTQHWSEAAKAGFIRGAYHFYRPEADALQQAQLFVKTVQLGPEDLPPVLDVEVLDGRSAQEVVAGVKVWLAHVEQATGRRPIVYSYTSFLRQHVGESLADYPLWLADYEAVVPGSESNWTFWQYGIGDVAGEAGCLDEDRFMGTVADLRAFAKRGVLPSRRVSPPKGAKPPQCSRPTASTEAQKPTKQASSSVQ
jgi:lysozyme